ncbi:MAG TPA: FliI/YscN family ATPase [Chloroflexota bacterium]|nr:FliI/YscN family ATPase [Chloroflexota bacterium]
MSSDLLHHSVLPHLTDLAPALRLCARTGTVRAAIGLTIEVEGLTCAIGEQVSVEAGNGRPHVLCQVVGFRDSRAILMPFGDPAGIAAGGKARAAGHATQVTVGDGLLGRVLDGLGRPLDDGPPLHGYRTGIDASGGAAHPLRRLPITQALTTGVRVLDGLLTCGRGQRLGIFAGSGVGKSTFMSMIARNSDSDINVIALIGERGREVQEFIDHNLGPEGLARSVVIVATSDQSALLRRTAAWVAATVAEYFRDRGRHVLFMMDSVTRFAMAQREIGLAVGEPPTTRGYTPSVFSLLPLLLERAGCGERGTITGYYTVLVEGDDMNEPITDAVRGTLDGHIVLSRELAAGNHYPSVDVLASVSRLMTRLVSPEHIAFAARIRRWMAAYRGARDLLEIGAYVSGTNPDVDVAVSRMPQILTFLRQGVNEVSGAADTFRGIETLVR